MSNNLSPIIQLSETFLPSPHGTSSPQLPVNTPLPVLVDILSSATPGQAAAGACLSPSSSTAPAPSGASPTLLHASPAAASSAFQAPLLPMSFVEVSAPDAGIAPTPPSSRTATPSVLPPHPYYHPINGDFGGPLSDIPYYFR
jgi:hypothetical protein